MRTNIYSGLGRILLALLFCCNGLFGQNDALHFDGVNDYIILSPIQNFSSNSDLTVEMWFTSEATGGNGTCTADFRRLFALGASGPNRFEVGECQGILSVFLSGTGYVQSTINVRDNQWHCISAVRQGGTINVYYDGNLVPAFTGLSASSLAVTYLMVGHGGATNALDWHGKVDDIKLWNIALSPANFTACGACVLKCNEPGLVAYWQLDEAQANFNNVSFSQVSDCTGNGNHGLLSPPNLFPPGFTLTNPSGLSNFTISTAPLLYPQYVQSSVFISDPLQTVGLVNICSGDPVHFSIYDGNGNLAQAGAGSSVVWEYSDDCFTTPGTIITPGTGALFSGFSFVSPPNHPATSVTCGLNSFVNRCYRAIITVTNGTNTCTYTTDPLSLQICCPISNVSVVINPPGPICEGSFVLLNVSLNGPAWVLQNIGSTVNVTWCLDGNPLGSSYDNLTSFIYPLGTMDMCFKAVITNCACPAYTTQTCIRVDKRPVCGSITGSSPGNLINLMPDPDNNPDHYIICPGNDAAIEMVDPTLFLNCNPVWQFMYPNTQPGFWNNMGGSNSNQNTGILPHSQPMISPYMWPLGETNIMYRIECRPLNPNSTCPPCHTNELRVCLKTPPPPPVITAVPSSICKGGNSFLSVQNPDPNCTYEWYANGLLVGFGDFLNTLNTVFASASACYTVTCFDGCFTVASNKVCVTVCEPIAKICCPVPICPCEGEPITLSGQEGPCSFGNCGPLTYSWSWTDINGQPQTATTPTITDIPAPGPLGTTYTLTVMDANGCTDMTQTTIVPCPN